MKSLKLISWITQFAFSVVSPLVLCIMGSVWLSRTYGFGKWIILVGVALGIGGSVSGLMQSLKTMKLLAKDGEKEHFRSYNDHI